jgi:hypothetical protein
MEDNRLLPKGFSCNEVSNRVYITKPDNINVFVTNAGYTQCNYAYENILLQLETEIKYHQQLFNESKFDDEKEKISQYINGLMFTKRLLINIK